MADSDKTGKLPPLSPLSVSEPVVKRKKKRPPGDDPSAETPSPTREKPVRPRKKKQPPLESLNLSKSIDDDNLDLTGAKDDENSPQKPVRRRKKKAPTTEASDNITDTQLNTENETEKSGLKRKKKKLKSDGDASEIKPESDQDDANVHKKVKPRKNKGKGDVKSSLNEDEYTDSGFAADLTSIEDDVIDKDMDEESPPAVPQSTTAMTILKSVPTTKLFIETDRGFKGEQKSRVAKRLTEDLPVDTSDQDISLRTSLDLALSIHNVTLSGSLFIHGLTAGIALWHIVIVYVMSMGLETSMLVIYQPLAQPVQCMFYLLFALCTLSAMDRSDVGYKTRKFFVRAITLQSSAISVIIYFLALIVSLSIVGIEDKIHIWGQFAMNENFKNVFDGGVIVLNLHRNISTPEPINVTLSPSVMTMSSMDTTTVKTITDWLINWGKRSTATRTGVEFMATPRPNETTTLDEFTQKLIWQLIEMRQDFKYTVQVWKNINTVRGVMAIVGWLVLAIVPKSDRLTKHLKAEDNIVEGMGDNQTSKA